MRDPRSCQPWIYPGSATLAKSRIWAVDRCQKVAHASLSKGCSKGPPCVVR